MKSNVPQSYDEICKVARFLLKDSNAWGKFPTPVDSILQCAELKVDEGVDLSKVDSGFWSPKLDVLKSAIRKVLGATTPCNKTIYLDLTQNLGRQQFIKLHETGHNVLSWQNRLMQCFQDNQKSLDPSAKRIFEREASCFASVALFQLERFNEEALRLPLALKSAMSLADRFGSSYHAAIGHYVQLSPKRCAVFVLGLPHQNSEHLINIRSCFKSSSFIQEFGDLNLPQKCGTEFGFVSDIMSGINFHETGKITLVNGHPKPVALNYHFFNNSYNAFVFLFPDGEKIKSHKKFFIKQ